MDLDYRAVLFNLLGLLAADADRGGGHHRPSKAGHATDSTTNGVSYQTSETMVSQH